MRLTAFILLLLALQQVINANAKEVIVGENQGFWTIGVQYAPINADVGDQLVFKYTAGVHDVWALQQPKCDFSQASGAQLVGTPAKGTYTATLDKPGTYYFACSVVGHCDAGQLLTVTVSDGSSTSSPSPTPPADSSNTVEGSCAPPVVTNATSGEVMVSCLSPSVSLAPGDNIYPDILLPDAYASASAQGAKSVVLRSISVDVVDLSGRTVPLEEVYLHHVFGDIRFVPAEGAEFRKSPFRNPLPAPYHLSVNTTEAGLKENRYANLHVIRTTGVAPDNIKSCIECWCDTDPLTGSIGCCKKCPTTSTESPSEYRLLFNVSYIIPKEETNATFSKVATAIALDIHGGIDYSTTPTTASITRTYPIDYFCPQSQPFSIIKCWAHQHIGANCVTVTDTATGAEICKSCPEIGTESGVVGNEAGYVVGMTDTEHFDPPYVLQPGQNVTITAEYKTDMPYAGVMSLQTFIFSDFDARDECQINYSGFVQPNTMMEVGGNRNITELQAGLRQQYENTDPKCTDVRGFYDKIINPCSDYGTQLWANTSTPDAASKQTCCSSLSANRGSLMQLFGSVTRNDIGNTCICSLGEFLLYSVKNEFIDVVMKIGQYCGLDGSEAADYGDGAIYVLLNSIFAPKCPQIAAQLATNSSSSMTMVGMGGGATDSQLGVAGPSPAPSSSIMNQLSLSTFTVLFSTLGAFMLSSVFC